MEIKRIELINSEPLLYKKGKGRRITALDLVLGHELSFDCLIDTGLPEPVENNLISQGGEVFLVSGYQVRIGSPFAGNLKEESIERYFREHLYMGKDVEVKIELAFDAGPDHMPFYRVWVTPC